MILSERFSDAMQWATDLHRNQERKGSGIPYISHLMSVAALVLEHGGDEDTAIAALLHDAVEDQGGRNTLEKIRERYGERVADMVEGCTDAYVQPKPPWRERKEAYLAHLASASPQVQLISAADKLHNAGSIVRDLAVHGESVWTRFKAGREGSLWYYRELANRLRGAVPQTMADELDRLVRLMHEPAADVQESLQARDANAAPVHE